MERSHATAFAPGRVNLIGEHTDYNEGLALPFAIDAGVTVRASATGGPWIEALAVDLAERDSFLLGEEAPSPGGWRDFVRGVSAELAAAGLPVAGALLEIRGSVRAGAGLSSSAALEVALCLALLALSDADVVPPWPLARICSRVENEWVGAQTGLLDQLASLCGRANAALRIDFHSGVITPVALELGEWRLVTLDSGASPRERAVRATTSAGASARRRARRSGIASLRELEPAMLARLQQPLDARARHVLEENERVDRAVDALARGDLAELGALLDRSHASLRDLYEVSTPAVEAAVEALRAAGAAGRAGDRRRLRRTRARASAAGRERAARRARGAPRPGGASARRLGQRLLLHDVAVADRPPRAAIFDFDGVLVDSYAAVTGAINAALVEHGLPARPPTELRHFIGPPTFAAFSELTGEPADSDAVAAIVATYRERYAAVYLTQTRVFDGIVPMLDALSQRMALALATSKSVLFAEPLLDALGLARYFVAVVAADVDDTTDDKTAIVGRALEALDRLGVAMVGDRSFDIVAARAHGLPAVGVTWGIGSVEELRAAGAEAIVDAPGELLALLDGERPHRR